MDRWPPAISTAMSFPHTSSTKGTCLPALYTLEILLSLWMVYLAYEWLSSSRPPRWFTRSLTEYTFNLRQPQQQHTRGHTSKRTHIFWIVGVYLFHWTGYSYLVDGPASSPAFGELIPVCIHLNSRCIATNDNLRRRQSLTLWIWVSKFHYQSAESYRQTTTTR